MAQTKVHSLFTEFDINLFKGGKHYRLYEKFGSHIITVDGVKGTYFAVWAPSAKMVSVIGDFNFWLEGEHQLNVRWDGSGIWEGFIPDIGKGTTYKYKIQSANNNVTTEKADPFARRCEHPPKTASEVWEDDYDWQDKKWMKNRKKKNALDAPFSVYEVHLGSWKKQIEENRFLSYRELADELVDYVKEMNFTHVEFMPIMEYPYDPSWGYQLTGYFAPTSRFGYPDEFKYLVDKFHEKGVGVLLDWVPSHFPSDDHGLGFFDGSHLYEHPDRRKGYHQDWKSLIFNYGRNEIKAFLISNAIFWLDQYHADGLRVDAVASMLFLDYFREEGEWEPNQFGGRENLDAIAFMKELNEAVLMGYGVALDESDKFQIPFHRSVLSAWKFPKIWRFFKKKYGNRAVKYGDFLFPLHPVAMNLFENNSPNTSLLYVASLHSLLPSLFSKSSASFRVYLCSERPFPSPSKAPSLSRSNAPNPSSSLGHNSC